MAEEKKQAEIKGCCSKKNGQQKQQQKSKAAAAAETKIVRSKENK